MLWIKLIIVLEILTTEIQVANFELSADNLRTRYVYEKDNVKFEIDDYERPAMKVVAIEGDKQKVDEICIKLQNAISSKEWNQKHILQCTQTKAKTF